MKWRRARIELFRVDCVSHMVGATSCPMPSRLFVILIRPSSTMTVHTGAKRKTCNYPGCTKNVKIQGKCSGHGPPRKVCEEEKCTRVAVQGGKCITHGAKKKSCIVEGCTKQCVLASMCKKHHDEYCKCLSSVVYVMNKY